MGRGYPMATGDIRVSFDDDAGSDTRNNIAEPILRQHGLVQGGHTGIWETDPRRAYSTSDLLRAVSQLADALSQTGAADLDHIWIYIKK